MAFFTHNKFIFLLSVVSVHSSDIQITISMKDGENHKNSFRYDSDSNFSNDKYRTAHAKRTLSEIDDILKNNDILKSINEVYENFVKKGASNKVVYKITGDSHDEDSDKEDEVAGIEDDKGSNDDSDDIEKESNNWIYLSRCLRSCTKKSCRWACEAAVRSGCNVYNCRKSLMSEFKKQCKKTCKTC